MSAASGNIFKLDANQTLVAVGLAISLFGILAYHRLDLYRKNLERQRNAAEVFVFAITNELSEVYPLCSKWPEHIDSYLRNRFTNLQSAVLAFRPFVKDKREFDLAWQFYRIGEYEENVGVQCYHQYMGFQINDEPVIDPKKQLKKNIDRLLSFSET